MSAVLTKTEYIDLITALLPDNNAREITESIMREMFQKLLLRDRVVLNSENLLFKEDPNSDSELEEGDIVINRYETGGAWYMDFKRYLGGDVGDPGNYTSAIKLEIANITSLQEALDEINSTLNPDRIISLGTETIVGNEYTYEDYTWQLGGVQINNIGNPIQIVLPSATTGFKRNDISVFKADGTIERIAGIETDGETVTTPDVPEGTLYFKTYFINGSTVEAEPEPPVIEGSIFKKKSESAAYADPTLTGSDAVIQFRPNGESGYAFSNAGLVSIDGFGLGLITGNPSAEVPYSGKDILIYNNKSGSLTLKHDGSGTAQCKFFFIDETDLIIPPGGKVWLKYGPSYCEMIFKSWGDAPDISGKLDKDITAGVERVWVYGTDGIGFEKPTSDFLLANDLININAKTAIEWLPTPNAWQTSNIPNVTGTADNTGGTLTSGLFLKQWRRRYLSASTAGSSTSFRDAAFRECSISEGFISYFIFGNEDAVNVAQARSFYGFVGGNGEIGNVNPSTVTNVIGVANNSGQANLRFIVTHAFALNHDIDLGSNFPSNTNSVDFYLLIMINDKGVNNLKWRVVNLHSGADTGFSTITTGLPDSTIGLSPQFWRNNGSTALAVRNSIILYRLLKL